MKQKIKILLTHPFIYGSAVVIVGNLGANFFNFIYNLYMSRSLSIADYGVLASIITFITFPGLVAGAINPVVIRFAGDYFAQNKLDLVRGLYTKLLKLFLLINIIFIILFVVNVALIGQFFHINNNGILIVTSVIMALGFINAINQAFIQAKLAFGYLVFLGCITAIVKVILGIIFVYLGYSVAGAVGALLSASVVACILGIIPLWSVFSKKYKNPSINSKELFKYGIPSALTLIGLTSYISTDIWVTKHFFNPVDAGLYAGLSLVGRIIFYITVPIGNVMFPIIIQKQSKKENVNNILKLAGLFVLVPSIILTIIYFFFPEFVILFFLKKSEYLAITPYLGYFAIYITLYCLLYLLATYYLSIKKTIVWLPIMFCALLQIVLLYFYHSNIQNILTISFSLVLLLVVSFLLYYPYAKKE